MLVLGRRGQLGVLTFPCGAGCRLRATLHTEGALCQELGIIRQTLYCHDPPTGQLRNDGRKVLSREGST